MPVQQNGPATGFPNQASVSGAGLVSSTNYADLTALQAAFPAASNDGKLGLAASVLYVSTGGTWTATGGSTTPIINNLTSTSTTSALSAAQGKALKDTADTLATTVGGKLTAASNLSDLASAATARTNLGLGTAATTAATAYATAAQGAKADSAVQDIGTSTAALTAKTTPVDADTLPLSDSAATGAGKKLSWLNIKATLKTYFDTLYQAVLVSGTTIKTINGTSVLGSGDLTISGGGTTVENVLTSTSTTNALSAAQGKALKDTADALATTVGGKLTAASNLSDLASAATARTNLGLGTAATAAASSFADASATTTALAGKADLSGGKLLASQLPDIAVIDYLGAVANQTAMLALTGQKGDWCTRTDSGTTWIITGSNPTLIGSWTQLSYPASAVVSVAGKTGVVTLSSDDAAEGATNLYFTVARVRAAVLTGLSTATNAVVAATDTVLDAFGKLQAQITGFASKFTLPSGASGTPTARDIYTVADTVRYRDSTNTERLLLNAQDNLANLANAATARTNLGAAASGAVGSSGLTMSTARLLGRSTAGTGAVEEIILGTGLSFSGTTLNATGGGGGSPGGSSGDLQYNNAGAFGAATGVTFPGTGRLAFAQGTITANMPMLNGSATLNSAGTQFFGIDLQFIDVASAATTQLMRVRGGAAGATDLLVLSKTGQLRLASSSLGQTAVCAADATDTGIGFTAGGGNPLIDIIRAGQPLMRFYSTIVACRNAICITTDVANATPNGVILERDANNILAQRNATAAQTLRIANSWTNASNGEWFGIDWQTTANTVTVGPQANGTGAVRPVSAVGNWTFAAPPRVPSYTVATLPVVGTGGRIARITDSSVAAAGNAGNAAVGGGANAVLVQDDGITWRIL